MIGPWVPTHGVIEAPAEDKQGTQTAESTGSAATGGTRQENEGTVTGFGSLDRMWPRLPKSCILSESTTNSTRTAQGYA